jgi:acyl carrier protein
MTRAMSFEQFKQVIADHFGVDAGRITKTTSFLDDLGLDSLSIINFIVRLEKKYAIKIEMDTLWRMKNIGEAYGIFMQRLNPLDKTSLLPQAQREAI